MTEKRDHDERELDGEDPEPAGAGTEPAGPDSVPEATGLVWTLGVAPLV